MTPPPSAPGCASSPRPAVAASRRRCRGSRSARPSRRRAGRRPAAPSSHGMRVDHRVDRRPHRLRPVEDHVGVELPPGQFAPVGRGAARSCRRRQVGQQRPRVDATPLQVRRHPAGAGVIRPIAIVVVPVDGCRRGTPASVAARRASPGSGSCMPSGTGAPEFRRIVPAGPSTSAGSIQLTLGTPPSPAGRAPAVRRPAAEVGREDRVPGAVRLAHPAGRHRVRRPGRHPLDVLGAQGSARPARRAAGRRARSPPRRARPSRRSPPASRGITAVRPAVHDQQPTAHRLRQRGQAAGQERPARRTGGLEHGVVGDEDTEHVSVVGAPPASSAG